MFCEVRTFAENGYQRVGAWFPLLGNNKRKLPYTENIITLAIHAAVWCEDNLDPQLDQCNEEVIRVALLTFGLKR